MTKPPSRDRPDLVSFAALGVVGASFGLRLPLLWVDSFNPDEFEHLHAAYSIARGLVPHRDYFENHLPLLHFALQPLFRIFDAENRPEQAVALVMAARVAMWLLSGASVAVFAGTVRAAAGRAQAAVAAALLCGTQFFLDKGFEVRPDVLGLALLVGSWRAFVAAGSAERGAWRPLMASGACLTLATLSTQKLVFAWPAAAIAIAVWAAREAPGARRSSGVAAWVAGLALPALALAGYFALHGALSPFVEQNVLLNARWQTRYSPRANLESLALVNGPTVVLALAGAALALRPRNGRWAGAGVLPTAALGSLLVGAFVIPVPLEQYFLPMMPPLAWLAAGALVRLARPFGRRQGLVLALALAVLAARPLTSLAHGLANPPKRPAWVTLEQLSWVVEHTPPAEPVLDGNTGLGVFRPHAWFYFYPNEDIRPFISDDETAELIRSLRNGDVAPRLAIVDRDLRALGGELLGFVEENYRPTGVGDLWALRDEPVDLPPSNGVLTLGTGATARLAGTGFFPPRQEGGRWFRESRGRASFVRVPLARASSARLTLHARREYAAPDAALVVRLNERELGTQPLRAGWHDYVFTLPPGALRVGLNRLTFAYPQTPREAGDANGRRNAVIAVDQIRFD